MLAAATAPAKGKGLALKPRRCLLPPRRLPTPGLESSTERGLKPARCLPTPGLESSTERGLKPAHRLPTPGLESSTERGLKPARRLPTPGLESSTERLSSLRSAGPAAADDGGSAKKAARSAGERGGGGGGSGKRARRIVIDISSGDDEDDECCVLDSDPFVSPNVNPKVSPLRVNADDDIAITKERGQVVACRDYPHSRHLCVKYSFNKTAHETCCVNCYCYVCDVLAPCKHWKGRAGHCHASDKDPRWKEMRRARVSNQGNTIKANTA